MESINTALARGKVQLLLRHPFYSFLLMHLQPVADNTKPTMGVDGRHLFYNEEFANQLSTEEMVGVLAHEVMHIVFEHLGRRGTRDPLKWNIAADYAVNLIVTGDGMVIPKGCLLDSKFKDMSTEQIYEQLDDTEAKKVSGQGGFCSGGTLDDHGIWGDDGDAKGDDSKSAAGLSGAVSKAYDPVVWRERIAQAANAARMQGKLPGSLSSLIEDVLHPKLDWRAILRNFIQSSVRSDYRMMPPNKRYLHLPIYLPSTYGDRVEVCVVWDTSGSISDSDLAEFIGETRGVVEQFEDYTMHIIQCDADVHDYTEVTKYEGEIPRKVLGRGGTDFRPPFAYLQEHGIHPPIVCYLTDGYGTFPDDPGYPVLWVMTTDIQPPFGDVIRLR